MASLLLQGIKLIGCEHALLGSGGPRRNKRVLTATRPKVSRIDNAAATSIFCVMTDDPTSLRDIIYVLMQRLSFPTETDY